MPVASRHRTKVHGNFAWPRCLRTFLLALALVGGVELGTARPANARLLTWTLTGSAGYGYEVHPKHHDQATNVMAALGLGFLADSLRLEMGVLGAWGAVWANGPRHAQLELRPMVRLKVPLIPLYGRVTFAGLLPARDRANIAYGGALGLSIPLARLALMAEIGTLPRRVADVTHWILEARLGLSWRL